MWISVQIQCYKCCAKFKWIGYFSAWDGCMCDVVPESWMSARTTHIGIRKAQLQRRLQWMCQTGLLSFTGCREKKKKKKKKVCKYGMDVSTGSKTWMTNHERPPLTRGVHSLHWLSYPSGVSLPNWLSCNTSELRQKMVLTSSRVWTEAGWVYGNLITYDSQSNVLIND
jgi:hypothetical protein